MGQEFLQTLARATPSKIVLLVIDGLGGLPLEEGGPTELEAARTPNLDALAGKSLCGLSLPVGPGITPGSGPAHLALFGYDPFKYDIGRGVLEALGIDFSLAEGDLAVRGNFCTLDRDGLIADRRAGRLPTQQAARLCQRLREVRLDGAQVFVEPVREHRFVAVFRGDGLSPEVADSDPQMLGVPPREVAPLAPGAARSAALANQFLAQARRLLASEQPANMVLFRGFSQVPRLPSMAQVYKIKPAAIASYPMYRGLAKLVGMAMLAAGPTLEDEVKALACHYPDFDFFYLHFKETDRAGEDGDFQAKVRAIEEVDSVLPRILELRPQVLVVAGDHSTPAALKGHSWHPVPFMLFSEWCRPDEVAQFSERACARGGLGTFPATHIMPLALANALKLAKYGP